MGRHVRRSGRVWVMFLVVVLAILSVALIYIIAARRQDDAKQAAVAQANTIADPILGLCAQGGDVGQRLSDAGLCSAAAVVKVGPSEGQSPGLTPEQVQALVKSELAKRPSPQPVGPSSTQLAGAVQAFITANPTLFKAPAPTTAQIQAAVNTYMRTHPVQVPQPVPVYQMPGLGGFTGVPQYPPAPQWPPNRRFSPR
ncbi:MAG: hypothetical protein JWO11_3511 [Nocardioides sp.]|nr:hypothetical protein [Nocardioides sp.]